MNVDLTPLLQLAIDAAERASQEILEVYHSDNFQTDTKGDLSPLTLADKRAHLAIAALLGSTGIPVLSEEGRNIPYHERKQWEYFWLVDPLDGTKEFIKRNGEFTVNIALIHQQVPVLGVVAVPVTGALYYGMKGAGAFLKLNDNVTHLSIRDSIDLTKSGLRVVASRSHMSSETEEFVKGLSEAVLVSAGSSLKFMMVASGEADVYPRFAPTMEWDTAASQAIVQEVGLRVWRRDDSSELLYNKESLLNPGFIVF